MDKASKAFRRSGVRLRSAGSGHTDLQLVISELKEMRSAARWFQSSQTSAASDLLKWALRGENRAIQETAAQLVELNMIWTEVQKTFCEQLKDHRHQFELMLEGENLVEGCKQKLTAAESREAKLRKEYKKALKKDHPAGLDLRDIEAQLKQATHARDLAQEELTESFKENEAVKLIRMKQSLVKLSESYLEMANKCIHVFEAHRDVAMAMPDVQDAEVDRIKYNGALSGRHAVHRAKERVDRYRRNSSAELSQPPPYNPHFPSQTQPQQRRSLPASTYPQLEGAWGWRNDLSSNSAANDSGGNTPTYINDLSCVEGRPL